eukprot:COSAG04_NODE_26633_length_292_cov_1.243523_1_plen_20_part_10
MDPVTAGLYRDFVAVVHALD